MASLVMFFRALMSCRLTPNDESETTVEALSLSSTGKIRGDENTTNKRTLEVDVSHVGVYYRTYAWDQTYR
ncbi:hypothetical protein CARUB_v10025446mg [Capsella rubella]|uniref:Uncharacterized protein n=1 Tax=Capsella rubella TaxID=81985 RepID=R0G1N8_9BRAS|nr:hypothetical protein CARUB_v10025446mg [Capsella rubella]